VAAGLPSRALVQRGLVLHVDRVFSVHGAGTVVTGTLWSGTVAAGDHVRLLPSGRSVRVRRVHVHDSVVEQAAAGQRVALNLAGAGVRDVSRGDAIVAPDSGLAPTTVLDARLELAGARHNQRVQVHHGTRDVPGRLVELGEGLWQLRLEQPLYADRDDRVVIRSIAPPNTLGGGAIVDPSARRHGRHRPRPEPAAAAPPAPRETGPAPLGPGALRLAERLRAAGHEPPSAADLGDEARHLPALRQHGLAVRVGRDRYAHPDAVADVQACVARLVERDGAATLASLRDELGTSRQFAQALLEHLDAARVTRRLPDDRRVLRRRQPA
jgi:selenocysteine-specific elongation factor